MGLLIAASAALRLMLGAAVGLGVDESYMVAAGRRFAWGYYDHPPLAWWLAHLAASVFGTEAGVAVRLPFIALFAGSQWLMFRFASRLYGAESGLWAAIALTLAPVFGLTTGGWVLPDGPLTAALLAAALALQRALAAKEGRWGAWLGAGLFFGLALLSKYTALLVGLGALLYLLTTPDGRRWLARPQPYAAAAVAVIVFAPTLLWNARHGFASFAFQGGRALGAAFHPFAPFTVLGGEALYLLPWIWAPMIVALFAAGRRGPEARADWLCFCLSLFPIVLFPIIAVWSRQRVLFHWAAPGYLFLFPLLGRMLAEGVAVRRVWVRAWLGLSLGVWALGLAAALSDLRWNWLEKFTHGKDPVVEVLDWTPLRDELASRGLLAKPGVFAALRWQDAGKLAYALGSDVPVVCLGNDPREFGLIQNLAALRGRDIVLIAPNYDFPRLQRAVEGRFQSLTALAPLQLPHAGKTALVLPAFLGRGFQPAR
ncbi:MAG: glycosyltransferase family 39 protein [Acidobacteriia bacterium]|nr:glycosyltransferase family 39 protein [Methyloceanibacter sp.]MCL6491384.1 glycosyltransferase family 39 protein [Terriglobia bacterium]